METWKRDGFRGEGGGNDRHCALLISHSCTALCLAQIAHEMSVPGLKVMVMAMAAYTVAQLSQLKLDEKLTLPSSKLAARGASSIGAVVLYAVVSGERGLGRGG
jgi:hypothetical protein